MRVARDWTWDAVEPVSFKVIRTLNGKTEEVGTIEMPGTISPRAAGGDRTGTDVLFLDAWDGKPPAGQPLREHQGSYTLKTVFRDPPPLGSPDPTWDVRVPITTPPSQTPKLISAGIALSSYSAAEDYSSTGSRKRQVWLEFDAPPADGHDLYFARVLAYSPDPILMHLGETIPEPEEPPLPIDPEWITVIHPGQPADASGFDAMQVLEQARDSKTHYLLPLPKGVADDAPELFGMWVYELRLGHDDTRWCKAQARFGPPLRVAGIQHPAPPLSCVVLRRPSTIETAAPYATPVLDGRILRPRTPLTEIWLLLYAQVQQLDRKGWRNVLLRRTRADLDPNREDVFYSDALTEHGLAQFDMATTWGILAELGLPRGTPLSVMAVELIPGHGTVRYEDPIGGQLGMVSVLRASALVPVPPVCV